MSSLSEHSTLRVFAQAQTTIAARKRIKPAEDDPSDSSTHRPS